MSKGKYLAITIGVMCVAMAIVNHPAEGKNKSIEQQFSGQGYGMAGCGLGSIVFGQERGMAQIFAATTNTTSGTQTFGITSGTSNCNDGSGNHAANLNVYVEANRLALANDVSRGSGETVEGLSHILGCQDEVLLGKKLQKNYIHIFPSQNVEAEQVSQSIVNTISSDSALASTCHT